MPSSSPRQEPPSAVALRNVPAGTAARQIRPSLCTYPGRTAVGSQHLNLDPEQSKNVPIFALLVRFLIVGRAQVGTLARRIIEIALLLV